MTVLLFTHPQNPNKHTVLLPTVTAADASGCPSDVIELSAPDAKSPRYRGRGASSKREAIGGRAVGNRNRARRATRECKCLFFFQKAIFFSVLLPSIVRLIITSVLFLSTWTVGSTRRGASSSRFREEHVDGAASRARSVRRVRSRQGGGKAARRHACTGSCAASHR